MGYSGDDYRHCGKCKKKTKHVRCPSCNGTSGGLLSGQCGSCRNSGHKCEVGKNDRYHN
jgi:hypothetical protein